MLRDYKKYMVIGRPMTGGKWIVRQGSEGLEKFIDKKDEDKWKFWSEYRHFQKVWIQEAMDPKSQEYEEDLIIESFDTFKEAYSFMDNLSLGRPFYQ